MSAARHAGAAHVSLGGREGYDRAEAAVRTLERLGYTHRGGREWAPPLGDAPCTPESFAKRRTVRLVDENDRFPESALPPCPCHAMLCAQYTQADGVKCMRGAK